MTISNEFLQVQVEEEFSQLEEIFIKEHEDKLNGIRQQKRRKQWIRLLKISETI